jgi:hypothetical protein
MQTIYKIILPDGKPGGGGTVDWPEDPGYERIKALVQPLLGPLKPMPEPLERVRVLWDTKVTDMFVSELGHVLLTHRNPLPINPEATNIYRFSLLKGRPDADPDSLPTIAGIAVLFSRPVWF